MSLFCAWQINGMLIDMSALFQSGQAF